MISFSMVKVVTGYGTLEQARELPLVSRKQAYTRFVAVAAAALATVAIIALVNSNVSTKTVLYVTEPDPAYLSDNQVII